jgi:hypothetical protein
MYQRQNVIISVVSHYLAKSTTWTWTTPGPRMQSVGESGHVLHHVTRVNHSNKLRCCHSGRSPQMHHNCHIQHLDVHDLDQTCCEVAFAWTVPGRSRLHSNQNKKSHLILLCEGDLQHGTLEGGMNARSGDAPGLSFRGLTASVSNKQKANSMQARHRCKKGIFILYHF